MAVRAIRGAVQVDANEREAILEGTTELVSEVMARNSLDTDDVISVVFTATPDLTAEFPALAARKIGFQDVPLLCGTEIAVPHARARKAMREDRDPLGRACGRQVDVDANILAGEPRRFGELDERQWLRCRRANAFGDDD